MELNIHIHNPVIQDLNISQDKEDISKIFADNAAKKSDDKASFEGINNVLGALHHSIQPLFAKLLERLNQEEEKQKEQEEKEDKELKEVTELSIELILKTGEQTALQALEYLGDALEQGYVFEKTANGGYRLIAPDGTLVTAAPQEPVTHSGL
jgi:hypothetical protein